MFIGAESGLRCMPYSHRFLTAMLRADVIPTRVFTHVNFDRIDSDPFQDWLYDSLRRILCSHNTRYTICVNSLDRLLLCKKLFATWQSHQKLLRLEVHLEALAYQFIIKLKVLRCTKNLSAKVTLSFYFCFEFVPSSRCSWKTDDFLLLASEEWEEDEKKNVTQKRDTSDASRYSK